MLLEDLCPDIVCLTESKLSDHLNSEVFDTEKYVVFRKDRINQAAPGGGVVVLVNRNLISSNSNVNFLNNHLYDESVWCELVIKDKKVLLGAIYRPPASVREKNNLLCDLIRLVGDYNSESQVLICGDFNFKEINWENNEVESTGQVVDANNFLDSVNDSFLQQHVMMDTHNLDEENQSRLDLIFTRDSHDIMGLELLPPVGKSHHAVIRFDFLLDTDLDDVDGAQQLRYNFHKANYAEIRRELEEVNWNELFRNKEVEEMYQILVNILCDLIDKYVPKIVCNLARKKHKWMTSEVRNKIKEKEKAWKRLRARKTTRRAEEYKRIRNATTCMIRQAKKAFVKKLCKDIKVNPKHFWSYVRDRTTLKEKVLRVRNGNGVTTQSDLETANVMNSAFQSVFINEDDEIPEFDVGYRGPGIENVEFDLDTVKELLKKTNGNKAKGPDGIHPRLLRECSSELAVPVSLIIRKSLDLGLVPALWLLGSLCPIYKKGDILDPLNYRPVSLTSVICKLCEKLVRKVVVEHLEENKLIYDGQHGFRGRRSTLTNLLTYMETLTAAVDNQIPVDVNYLDCRKAFDTVPHKRLLAKLEAYGIRGKILEWIKAFLTGREQYVEIRGTKSDKLGVTSGVPQGSVLGPVLFLIYINDLVSDLECPVLLFADDAKIFKEIRSQEDIEAMQRDLKRLETWSVKWLLNFNADKCVTMHIGHRNPHVDYALNRTQLKESTTEKDLGVHVSADLKPSHHVNIAAAKGNRMVGLIKRHFPEMDLDTCHTLYCALVRPHLEYAVQSWSPYYRKDIIELEKVQRRMTKLVPELKDLDYEARCEALGLTTLEKRRRRGDLIETYKILNGFEDIDYKIFFEYSDTSTRSNTCKLKKRGHWRTLVRANAFSVRVVNSWNSLPEDVVNAPSISSFKSRLDKCAF